MDPVSEIQSVDPVSEFSQWIQSVDPVSEFQWPEETRLKTFKKLLGARESLPEMIEWVWEVPLMIDNHRISAWTLF